MNSVLANVTFVAVAGIALEANLLPDQQHATPPSPSMVSSDASSPSITFTGCVHQASDDPRLFAFQRRFTGRSVSVKGTVIPGRDVDGAEVVIHETLPDEVEVRAFDLRSAPEAED